MNCECKKELESKLLARFKEQSPEAFNHDAALSGYGLALTGNTMKSRAYMDVKQTANFPLKKGGSKQKTVSLSMFFSYCPFCGVKA